MKATPQDADALEALALEVEHHYEEGISHTAADTQFHAKLGEISGNLVFPNLAPIISKAINMFIDLTHAELKQETIESHRAIVEAVRKNDAVGARRRHDAAFDL